MAAGLRALLLEHDSQRASSLVRALERAGWSVSASRAQSADEFRELAREPFDVVLARLGRDGFDAHGAIAELARARAPAPVVAILEPGAGSADAPKGASAVLRSDDLGLAPACVHAALESGAGAVSLTQARHELARYRRFFVEGPVIVFRWIAREGWPVEYVSPNVVQLFGVDAEALTSGRVPYAALVHPDDLQRVAAEVAEHSAAGVQGFDQQYRIVRPDGAVRWLFDHTLVARDASGTITHYEGYVLDDTERRTSQLAREELQQQMLQAQKLESLGVLAGGIAHDFNNLLTAVLGNAGLAMQSLDRAHPARAALVQVNHAVERAADLTRQLLAYAGRGTFEKRPIDASALVREIVQLATSSLPKKVLLRVQLADDLPAIDADPAQLQQVVMNLVINGGEACGDSPGTVTVTTSRITADEHGPRTDDAEPLAPGEWVEIEVRDDGGGMDAATRERIFEPFFTTKFQGRGLGLSAVLGILHAHGGGLRVESQPQRGSTFRVFLPATRDSVRTSPSARTGDLSGHGLVLVVDDEPTVLQVASRALRAHGYEVSTARDGRQGAELFRARSEEIDVVLLDLTMPEMDGEQALVAMRAARPDVRAIVASGYDEDEARHRFRERPPSAFLRKPYSIESLAAKVKEVLSQPAHARG